MTRRATGSSSAAANDKPLDICRTDDVTGSGLPVGSLT